MPNVFEKNFGYGLAIGLLIGAAMAVYYYKVDRGDDVLLGEYVRTHIVKNGIKPNVEIGMDGMPVSVANVLFPANGVTTIPDTKK
jgi:hypothetical protein